MESRPTSSETLMYGIGQVAVKYGEPTSSRKRELQEKMQVTWLMRVPIPISCHEKTNPIIQYKAQNSFHVQLWGLNVLIDLGECNDFYPCIIKLI